MAASGSGPPAHEVLPFGPAELANACGPFSGACWRLVEAQHHVSTLKLVDTLDEQALLERLLEDTKPALPLECRHLHYLLATPFRYGAVYPVGSRFRRAGLTPGVFYASDTAETAVAEIAFYRLLFFAESPQTPWPSNPAEFTAFATAYSTDKAIDLTRKPFSKHDAAWTSLTDYAACQSLAETARASSIEIIRYRSVRDPGYGINVAILACRAFTQPEPLNRRTWRIHLRASGVQAVCEAPKLGLAFGRETFAADPRIAALRWERNEKPVRT